MAVLFLVLEEQYQLCKIQPAYFFKKNMHTCNQKAPILEYPSHGSSLGQKKGRNDLKCQYFNNELGKLGMWLAYTYHVWKLPYIKSISSLSLALRVIKHTIGFEDDEL